VLNPHIPPFDDVRVRRAINYAVDRGRIVEVYGGPTLANATCQILPPNLPAYEPYCPYSRGTDEWTTPDRARALQLIQASGTAGMAVTVWTSPTLPGGAEVGRYFRSLLESLGYRATIRSIEDADQYFDELFKPANRIQIGIAGWFADYPAASNFLVTLLSCDGLINYMRFCDPAIDSRMSEAARLQSTDPASANELWAQIERALVDEAPLVPLINPALVELVSDRLGNYQRHPVLGLLLSRIWVR
jgi:peptide/nickel transport system substrate-binding protein